MGAPSGVGWSKKLKSAVNAIFFLKIESAKMKIASWNVNSLNIRLPHVLKWLKENPVDILGLQEIKTTNEKFPIQAFSDAGWNVVFSGQKSYNGVAIVSKHKIQNVQMNLPNWEDPAQRLIAADVLNTRFVCVYVPNGADLQSEKFVYKKRWLAAFLDYLKNESAQHLVIGGDFNIAPTDSDVCNPLEWRNQVCCSQEERTFFFEILRAGFFDSFRLLHSEGEHFSWWDYRQGAFRRNQGLRIDFLLARMGDSQKCIASGIDPAPRAWERPSDHAPVWAEFDF